MIARTTKSYRDRRAAGLCGHIGCAEISGEYCHCERHALESQLARRRQREKARLSRPPGVIKFSAQNERCHRCGLRGDHKCLSSVEAYARSGFSVGGE